MENVATAERDGAAPAGGDYSVSAEAFEHRRWLQGIGTNEQPGCFVIDRSGAPIGWSIGEEDQAGEGGPA
jgi:hypothetical protein